MVATLPDEAARQRAAKLVQDTFQDELAAATTGAQKVALAQEMLRKSKATGDDPAGRYALLAAGYALAKEANDPVTALQAIDRMAHYFAVDAWSKKTQLLSEMADAAKMLTHHRVIAEQALVVTQKATEACRFEVAARLSELAVGQAGKAQEPRLLTRARAIAKECNRALTQFRQYDAAKAKLEQPGGDPQASLAAGRYECLILGDWDAGLRKLAAGSDESLRSLAAKDLATPEDADARAAVGDGWWELAKDESDAARATLYRRAAWWYEKALPQATGVLKIKLQKRLDTIKAAAAKPASP